MFSKTAYFRAFLFCVSVIVCCCQITAAQSGRRVVKKPVSAVQTSSAESKPAKIESDASSDKDSVRISSLTVVGELQHNFVYQNSNTVDNALKELIRTLQTNTRILSEITRGSGKTNYKEAKDLAEKETDKFVLWLGFVLKYDNYANLYIESIQYLLLSPKGANVLTRGQIAPDHKGVLSPGGVLNIPRTRRRTVTELSQMKQGVREIAAILVRGGWIK